MSYDLVDDTQDKGAPANLYSIKVEGRPFYYTDHQRELVVNFDGKPRKFTPKQISRTGITNAYNLADASVTDVILPINDPASYILNGLITPQIVEIQISEVHINDPALEVRSLLVGFVTGIAPAPSENTVTLSVSSLTAVHLSASVPTVTYSRNCNHAFGDEHCKFDVDSISAKVTATDNNLWTVTVNRLSLDKFEGGTVTNLRSGVTQNIVTASDGKIVTIGGFADLLPGDQLKLTPGCNKLVDGDCATKYNNAINFGGYPKVPRKNPFIKGFGERDLQEYGGAPT